MLVKQRHCQVRFRVDPRRRRGKPDAGEVEMIPGRRRRGRTTPPTPAIMDALASAEETAKRLTRHRVAFRSRTAGPIFDLRRRPSIALLISLGSPMLVHPTSTQKD